MQQAKKSRAIPVSQDNEPTFQWSNGRGPTFMDAFSGLGGFHLGLHSAGAECVVAVELDEHARKTYEHNLKRISPNLFANDNAKFFRDIRDVLKDGHDGIARFDILTGGFPCQPFSIAGKRDGFNDEERGQLIWELLRIIKMRRPIGVLLENVRHILSHDKGRTWLAIRSALEGLGYEVFSEVIKGPAYGIPQLRPRVFIVCLRRNAFACDRTTGKLRHPFVFPHQSGTIYPLNFTLDELLGGKSGRESALTITTARHASKTFPRKNFRPWDIYRIIDPEGTVRDVKLTVEMCQRLMGLPENFEFPPEMSERHRIKQLGNSVIIPIVKEVARQMIKHIEAHALPTAKGSKLRKFVSEVGESTEVGPNVNDNELNNLAMEAKPSFWGKVFKPIREIWGGLVRKQHVPVANDNHPVDNDNISKPKSGAGMSRAKGRASSVAVYQRGKARCAFLRLNSQRAGELGLNAGDSVEVSEQDGSFLLKIAKTGVKVSGESGLLLIRKSGVYAEASSAIPVTMEKDGKGIIRVRYDRTLPNPESPPQVLPKSKAPDSRPESLKGFTSLLGQAGDRRLKLLKAGPATALSMGTTSAGDECYTPRFLIDLVLKAGRRKVFDIDSCSMQCDGRYDIGLSPKTIKDGVWKGPKGHELQVIGHVPAKRYFTKDSGDFGSLLLPWKGDLIWLNPPYTLRLWVVFLEKVAKEVADGNAGIAVALVPKDDTGEHIGYMFDENAYRIEFSHSLPFFMRQKTKKQKDGALQVVGTNTIEAIRGNQLVIFGKGTKTRNFLLRLVSALFELGYITAKQQTRYVADFNQEPRLNDEASVTSVATIQNKTKIAWATETVNPFKGCTKVGPECKHCYALNWAQRHQGKGSLGYAGTVSTGKFTGVIGIVDDLIDKLKNVRSERVFVNSTSDTFHENVPDQKVVEVFDAMSANPNEDTNFLVCTKRSQRMATFSQGYAIPDKVWCGTTVGCKKSLSRLDDLRMVKAKIRWVSVEPLLEPLDLTPWLADGTLSWVVVGGESGNGHRPMDKAWAEDIWRQCQKYNVPFFLKQWSARSPKLDVEYPPTIDGQVWHQYPST